VVSGPGWIGDRLVDQRGYGREGGGIDEFDVDTLMAGPDDGRYAKNPDGSAPPIEWAIRHDGTVTARVGIFIHSCWAQDRPMPPPRVV
jgi:hypothetical protein